MEDQTVKNPDKGGVQSVARIFELIEVLAATRPEPVCSAWRKTLTWQKAQPTAC